MVFPKRLKPGLCLVQACVGKMSAAVCVHRGLGSNNPTQYKGGGEKSGALQTLTRGPSATILPNLQCQNNFTILKHD